MSPVYVHINPTYPIPLPHVAGRLPLLQTFFFGLTFIATNGKKVIVVECTHHTTAVVAWSQFVSEGHIDELLHGLRLQYVTKRDLPPVVARHDPYCLVSVVCEGNVYV
jgi:hypothetical protein